LIVPPPILAVCLGACLPNLQEDRRPDLGHRDVRMGYVGYLVETDDPPFIISGTGREGGGERKRINFERQTANTGPNSDLQYVILMAI